MWPPSSFHERSPAACFAADTRTRRIKTLSIRDDRRLQMDGELKPITEPGKRFVALAEEHAADFATRARDHDLAGSLPHEHLKALQPIGFQAAPLPEAL